jgi:hypothetical protein
MGSTERGDDIAFLQVCLDECCVEEEKWPQDMRFMLGIGWRTMFPSETFVSEACVGW